MKTNSNEFKLIRGALWEKRCERRDPRNCGKPRSSKHTSQWQWLPVKWRRSKRTGSFSLKINVIYRNRFVVYTEIKWLQCSANAFERAARIHWRRSSSALQKTALCAFSFIKIRIENYIFYVIFIRFRKNVNENSLLLSKLQLPSI